MGYCISFLFGVLEHGVLHFILILGVGTWGIAFHSYLGCWNMGYCISFLFRVLEHGALYFILIWSVGTWGIAFHSYLECWIIRVYGLYIK
ncbi:MAG: hypothetical protein K0R92_2162 [Lachnospiraceae bacterium]|jgi:hypothetical protein|nr:hypothetical protein [Lachnospiraceae bacterium]